MKRYRVLSMDFDTRANILSLEIKNDWEPKIKKQWEDNKQSIKDGIVAEYGILCSHNKINDFIALGAIPFSIIAFHNKFIRQARDAFIIGGYYPCLVASCALGERVLNQLILHLRDYYKSHSEYKKVYRKDSFDNWDVAIDTLEAWEVLLPEAVAGFRELRNIRNAAIHFNPETDRDYRTLAINAFQKICYIIKNQFGTERQPWYIEGINGATFVKKEKQEIPFVKEIVLPNCKLVGYRHTLEMKNNKWLVHDSDNYTEPELTDEEFKELYNNKSKTP